MSYPFVSKQGKQKHLETHETARRIFVIWFLLKPLTRTVLNAHTKQAELVKKAGTQTRNQDSTKTDNREPTKTGNVEQQGEKSFRMR